MSKKINPFTNTTKIKNFITFRVYRKFFFIRNVQRLTESKNLHLDVQNKQYFIISIIMYVHQKL